MELRWSGEAGDHLRRRRLYGLLSCRRANCAHYLERREQPDRCTRYTVYEGHKSEEGEANEVRVED
jgi:hypothetical protein